MRSSASLVAISLVILGCGGDLETSGSPASADLMQGIWRSASSAEGCVDLYAFYGDQFERVWFCELTDGRYSAEKYEGTYAWTGEGEAQLTLSRSSCSSTEKTVSVQVEFADGKMRLTSAFDSVLLTRGSRADTRIENGMVAFGCFGEDGGFDKGAVRDLR